MNKKFIRSSAAIAVCLAILTGASCGKVETNDGNKKTVVSENEEPTSVVAADASKNTIPDADGTTSGDKNREETSEPTSSKGHTAQGSTEKDLPVSGQPSGGQSQGNSGTGQNQGNAGTAETGHVKEITLTFYETTLPVGGSKMPIVTMLPENAANKDELWTSSNESVAIVDAYGNITGVGEGSCTVTVSSCDSPEVKANVTVTVEAPSEGSVVDGVTYIDGILIANKTYALPANYNPGGLTGECSAAFQNLVNGAAADNINIYLSSGFRSYDYQAQIYNNYVAMDGQANADTYSARPGHSEHQTGLAIDCNIIDDSFAGTPEAIWLENHCHEYGFIIRYPQSKESITGYKYEPWHIRYIGVDKAKAVHDSGLCLEEYLNITSVYNY